MQRSNDMKTVVENNLLPPMIVEGSTNNGKNIFEEMKRLHLPSIAITVIEDGKIAWSQEYHQSVSDDAHDQAADLSIFQAASISKSINAVLALKVLVESGEIGLDEDVNPYLKGWKIPNADDYSEKVTLRRLLSHTAGVNVGGFPGYMSTNKMIPTLLQELIGNPEITSSHEVDAKDIPDGYVNTAPVKLVEVPGAKYSYSGGGITIVQKLIEDVTGESYADLAKRYIFDPLKMSSSSFKIKYPDSTHEVIQPGCTRDGKQIDGSWHIYPESAAAGLWTTTEDLAKFAIAVRMAYLGYNPNLLSQHLASEMLRIQPNSTCGLGFFIPSKEHEGELTFSHNGSNEGYLCDYLMLPNKGVGVVVMTNSDIGLRLGSSVIRGVFDAYNWPGRRPEVKKVVVLDPVILDKCTGEFKIKTDKGSPVAVFGINEGKLFIRLPFPTLNSSETKEVVLLPESDHDFFNPEENLTIKFSPDYREITFGGLSAVRSIADLEPEPQFKYRLV